METFDLKPERLLFSLNALADLGEEMTSVKDFKKTIKSSLYMAMGTFYSTKGGIFQYDYASKKLNLIASKGIGKHSDISIDMDKESMKELFSMRNKPIDLVKEKRIAFFLDKGGELLVKLGAKIVAPLVVKDELVGLLFLNEKFSNEKFTSHEYKLLSIMAMHISMNIHSHSLIKKLMHKYRENKTLYENLTDIYYSTIFAFSAAIDAKDEYTKDHSRRVSTYSTVLAREMGWSDDDVECIRIAGLLHDIGKLAVDKTIINKPCALSKNECGEINSHPVIGYEILSKVKLPWSGIPRIVRGHHEWVDGSGYPDGLTKDGIPLGARVMAFVDSFDAMTTDRPYRPKLPLKDVMDEVKKSCGRQFERSVVNSFFSLMRREVLGEVERPSIVPLLKYDIEPTVFIKMLDDFELAM